MEKIALTERKEINQFQVSIKAALTERKEISQFQVSIKTALTERKEISQGRAWPQQRQALPLDPFTTQRAPRQGRRINPYQIFRCFYN